MKDTNFKKNFDLKRLKQQGKLKFSVIVFWNSKYSLKLMYL